MMAVVLVGCATAPKTTADRTDLSRRADATLETMKSRDAGLAPVLARAAGYVVFPYIGKGGMIVGGAFGRGILYQGGHQVGFVKLEQAKLGALLGGESFAELLVLDNPYTVLQLKKGDYKLGGNIGATVLTQGAAAAGTLESGTSAFIMPLGGAMIDVSVDGQRFKFDPGPG